MWIVAFLLIQVAQANYIPTKQEDFINVEKPPTFITPGQTYRIAAGATVILPCRITQPGSYVLAWKRNIAILTAGPIKVTPDPRIRVLPSSTIENPGSNIGKVPELSNGGYSLELRDVRPQDAGDYICQLGTIEPKEIVHTLEVLVPARIHYISHKDIIEVTAGHELKMECRASGNPVPVVTWSKKLEHLPSGEKYVQGLTLTLHNVDRHAAGEYECSASNSVGEPDTRHITVKILYPPEVQAEKPTVHTGLGLEAQLVCIVYAEPIAHVLWFKESTQLGTTEQHATHSRGNRYTLTIRNVSEADMGNYTCLASNANGKSRGHVILTGTPDVAEFDYTINEVEKDKFTLSWSVESHSPILEYRLFYRVQPKHHHHHHDDHINNKKSNYTRYPVSKEEYMTKIINGPTGNKIDSTYPQIIPPARYPGVVKQKMVYTLTNLQPGNTYEIKIQARNEQGWNKISQTYHFSTRPNNELENIIEPSAQPAVYGSASGGHGLNNNIYNNNKERPFIYGLYFICLCMIL